MARRRTGTGGVGFFPNVGKNYNLLLYNFDIDGFELKPEHKLFLDAHVLPILAQNGSAIIRGMCSRSGSMNHNLGLSYQRALQVEQYLRKKTNKSLRLITLGLGERPSAYDNNMENQFHRAVELVVSLDPVPPEKPKKKPRKPTGKKTTVWRNLKTWVNAKTLDILAAKILKGVFVIGFGFCDVYAWKLSVTSGGVSLGAEGTPPLMPGDLATYPLSISYDPSGLDLVNDLRTKTVTADLYGYSLDLKIHNALRAPVSTQNSPIKGRGLRTVGRDLIISYQTDGGEAGYFKGMGSIDGPWRRTPENCA